MRSKLKVLDCSNRETRGAASKKACMIQSSQSSATTAMSKYESESPSERIDKTSHGSKTKSVPDVGEQKPEKLTLKTNSFCDEHFL